jgi:hypothetical protein
VLEVPFYSALPQYGDGRYRPMMLGRMGQAADTCPTRSLWWLLLAGGVGVAAGYYVAKGQKKGRRA